MKLFVAETIALFLCIFLVSLIDSAPEEKTCAQATAEMGKRQMAKVSECTKQLAYKTPKEKKEKSACLMKCVMVNVGVIKASDGKFDMVAIEKMIEEEMPPNLGHLREKGEAMFMDCKNKHEPNLDNDEPNCKSYGALVKCLMGMATLCKD